MQEEGMENKIMADAQKVLLAKVKDQNVHFFKIMWSLKNVCWKEHWINHNLLILCIYLHSGNSVYWKIYKILM